MSIMDFRDRLDAESASKLANSHGDSDSIAAFRDRTDANYLVREYNRAQAVLKEYHQRMGEEPVEKDKLDSC